jgi:hypothetical protein
VWGDKALAVKESKQHLFGPAGMDLGPYFGLASPTWSTAGTAFLSEGSENAPLYRLW